MAQVYASLIVKDLKTINDVPASIRNETKQALIDCGHPELAGNA